MGYTLIEEFPEIAEMLAPSLRHYPTESVETLLRQRFGVESIESFGKAFRQLQKSASGINRAVPAAMPILRSAAPLLPIAGQVAGTMLGGPAGAMVGGAIGNMAGQALSGKRGAAAAGGIPVGPAANLTGAMPASAKLLSILGRPEILQSLASMALGPAGNPSAAVAGRQVPIAAIANLIGSLAQQAEEEYRIATLGAGESMPDYLTDDLGTPCCDVADADERALRLFELLTVTETNSLPSLSRHFEDFDETEPFEDWEYEEDFDTYDDAELGEIWAEEALEGE